MTLDDLVVFNLRWWPGEHYFDGVPLFVAENLDYSTVVVDHRKYDFSRVVDGRRAYVLKEEYRREE